MEVKAKISFYEYWTNAAYYEKKPARNGSNKMLVGDNIYWRDPKTLAWCQADSHHSMPDGGINIHNVKTDTSADAVLISHRFLYFGREAPPVPKSILKKIAYQNVRNYRRIDYDRAKPLIDWLTTTYSTSVNQVLGDPFDFDHSARRYSVHGDKII